MSAPSSTRSAPASGRRASAAAFRGHVRRSPQVLAPLIVLIAAWELLTRSGALDPFWVSRPSSVVQMIGEWLGNGELAENGFATFRVACMGLAVGAVVGTVSAVLLEMSDLLDQAFAPLISIVYSMPKPALVPVLLFVFGIGDTAKVILVFLLVVFVFFYNIRAGLETQRKDLSNQLMLMGASRRDRIRHLMVPTLVPFLISSLRIAFPLALIGTVFAEFFGARSGLGFVIYQAGIRLEADPMIAAITVVAVVGAGVDLLLRVESARWKGRR